MSAIILDNIETIAQSEIKRWTELLKQITAERAKQGQKVTAMKRKYRRKSALVTAARIGPDEIAYSSLIEALRKIYPYYPSGHGSRRAAAEQNAIDLRNKHTTVVMTERLIQAWRRQGKAPLAAYHYVIGLNRLAPRAVTGWRAERVRLQAAQQASLFAQTY